MKRACAVLLACGCGFASGPDYRGEPLLTLRGQVSTAQGFQVDGPVRLAVIWYPVLAGSNAPLGTSIEEVESPTGFPQPFELKLYAPPDDKVLAAPPGWQFGRSTIGQLVAYHDANRNGRLEVAGAGEPIVDRVLAVSAFVPGVGSGRIYERVVAVTYLEPPLASEVVRDGLKPGFNVTTTTVSTMTTEISTTTAVVDLELRDDPFLSMAICSDAYAQPPVPNPCGLGTGQELLVNGFVTAFDNGRAEAVFFVTRDGAFVTDATITLNGTRVPWPGAGTGYGIEEAVRSVVRLGANQLRVDDGKGGALEARFDVPAELTLTAPASVRAGAPFTLAWAAVSGVLFYSVEIGGMIDSTTELTYSAMAPATPGPLPVIVAAEAFNMNGIRGRYEVARTVDVTP